MGFSVKQVRALSRNLAPKFIRTRRQGERELSYIEAWHAIAEANRIFGFDGWSRETLETKCLAGREIRGAYYATYIAKVRIVVHANNQSITRDGHGTGDGRGTTFAEAHDNGLKAAETDATKRALATFGKPFGLSLYLHPPIKEAAHPAVQQQPTAGENAGPPQTNRHPPRVEQTETAIQLVPKRIRNKAHLLFVGSQPCLICGRQPTDAHHLRFAQPRAMGMKVSDEFTVPLCRIHHRQVHQSGNEAAWWNDLEIDALEIAKRLWDDREIVARHAKASA